MKKQKGFTLSEIMITILVIGVVATITIPSLIQKTKEETTVKRVLKTYSSLQNAYLLAVEENGVPSYWGIPLKKSNSNSKIVRDKLLTHIKASKKCNDTNSQEECGLAKKYKYFSGNLFDAFVPTYSASIITTDGIGIQIWVNDLECSHRGNTIALNRTLGFVNIDINGNKKPNVVGKDFFLFYITDYGIIPVGTSEETSFPITECYKNGRACTAWVIKQKNMNYLHSKKCSWNNTSCK